MQHYYLLKFSTEKKLHVKLYKKMFMFLNARKIIADSNLQ